MSPNQPNAGRNNKPKKIHAKFVCYEFKPPLVHTKNGWRLFYKQYITEWNSFKDWWFDMIQHYKLIKENNNDNT